MKNVIKIPEGTTIGYLTTEIEDQLSDTIPDFPQLLKTNLAELTLSNTKLRLEMQCQLNREHTEYYQPAMRLFIKKSIECSTMD
ncbi:hypothetical protein G9A89_022925 [Geosiphon pyriformis]|nr:hypothetical protein G9A89_022925 [Geosiphon pyriformis]